jgi:hypothetical protein
MHRIPLLRYWLRSLPCLEALEQRCLPSMTFMVTNNSDSGTGSLRQAILDANANPGMDTIAFNVSPGMLKIQPASSNLPTITDSVLIDGTTQPGYIDTPLIQLDGSLLGSGAIGLTSNASNVTVKGLAITRFSKDGVFMQGSSNSLQLSFIGLDGNHVAAGNGNGVFINQATGDSVENTNDIENNTQNGILISHSAGIIVDGNSVESNGQDGIQIVGNAPSSGQAFATRIINNEIESSHLNGIHLIGSSNNQIGTLSESNYIGTDIVGDTTEGNGQDGVRIESSASTQATNNSIADNYIAGNGGNGVSLTGPGTSKNSLVNNLIGLSIFHAGGSKENPPTLLTLGNKLDGVAISNGANHNMVGGAGLFLDMSPTAGAGNVISANLGNGVNVHDFGTTANNVQGNLIGTDPLGTKPIGNGVVGVVVSTGASGNLIGGTGGVAVVSGQGNVISGNSQGGMILASAGTTMNVVQGNFIGTDFMGANAVNNIGSGVVIELGASKNTIGGGPRLGNVISGNVGDGVLITDVTTNSNLVQSNTIGTDVSGTTALENASDGVFIRNGASGNLVGGVNGITFAFVLGNLISGNHDNGVGITGNGTRANMVQGNEIGTNASGAAAIPNSLDGVVVSNSASGNLIGGGTGAGNLISGNSQAGVGFLTSASMNRVQGNLIGTDSTTNAPLGNGTDGVDLDSTMDIVVGNVISGNLASGVLVLGSQNIILANKIGTNFSGTAAVANKHDGVLISLLVGTGSNKVGMPGNGNLISGNGGNGIDITGPPSSMNLIQGNDIGTAASGKTPLHNFLNGILVNGTTGYTIGGTTAGAGNLISGNVDDGVQITGPVSSGIVVQGNRIGTDLTGTLAVPNEGNGVQILDGANNNTVGGAGATAGPANLISGNNKSGVVITGAATNHNFVEGNFIGTNNSGSGGLRNLGDGVDVLRGAAQNQVGGAGGTGPGGLGNLISGNSGDGVLIAYFGTTGNMVLGNQIGTDTTGKVALANQGNGVHIFYGASNNTVGAAGAVNLISGNALDGVRIDFEAGSNLVQGNLIGTDVTGAMALANGGDGVHLLLSAGNNTIGGLSTSAPGPSNIISGNGGSGVVLTDPGTNHNFVEGNFIGTAKSGVAHLGNLGDGVDILNGAFDNQIGGTGGVGPTGLGNLISANGGDGVLIEGAGTSFAVAATSFNSVQGNLIGTDSSGKMPLANAGHGVFVAQGAQNNSIGGTTPTPGNVIAFNAKAGVAVGSNAADVNTLHNPILSNSIFQNGALGIDLGNNGVTLNTPGGPHVGPNEFQNFPIIPSAVAAGSITHIVVALNSIPSTTFTIQVFANPSPDPSGFGQGQTLIATTSLTTAATGNGAVVVMVPQNLAGQFVAATATAPSMDTSEFGKDVRVLQGLNAVTAFGAPGALTTALMPTAVAQTEAPSGQGPASEPHALPLPAWIDADGPALSRPTSQEESFPVLPAARRELTTMSELDNFFVDYASRLAGVS